MTQSAYQRIGDAKLPIPSLVSDSSALDPVRARMLALFQAAVVAELGEQWLKVVGTLDAEHPLAQTLSPVGSAIELEPSRQVMQELNLPYPVLALHRSGEARYDEFLIDVRQRTQAWSLHWVLGELSAPDIYKLGAFFNAFELVVLAVLGDRGHPSYESGMVQFGPDRGRLKTLDVISSAHGQSRYGTDEGPLFWTTIVELESTEVMADVEEAYEPLEGASYDMNAGGDGELFPSVAKGDTDFPPTES